MNKDTQTCKSCKTEKPLTEFHRRGEGHRKQCKTCTNASARTNYAERGRTRLPKTSTFDRSNMPTVAETLQSIDSKLRAKAAAYTNDMHSADDLYSRMVEEILTRAEAHETVGMLLQRANWIAYDFVQKSRTYNHRVDTVEEVETLASPTTVEDEIIEQEVSAELKAVIEQLPAEYQQVVSLLTLGLTQREIAKRLKVTEQAVSQKIKRVGSKMVSLGFSPA
jgi:RNA polymerase sigma factor (sigma-70 family)